jgi:hypothetical protein
MRTAEQRRCTNRKEGVPQQAVIGNPSRVADHCLQPESKLTKENAE